MNELEIDKQYIINKILKLKDYDKYKLQNKSLQQLEKLLNTKLLKELEEKRCSYIRDLSDHNPKKFNFNYLSNLSLHNLKELYEFNVTEVAKKPIYIDYIHNITNVDKNILSKWSTDRLKHKYIKLQDENNKKDVLSSLRSYGDGISLNTTPLNILQQRNRFLIEKGTNNHAEKRMLLSQKFSKLLRKNGNKVQYKRIMTMDIITLESKYNKYKKESHRKNLIDYLRDNSNIDEKTLKRKKTYILEYLKADLQPTADGSRSELIKILSSKNFRSRNTLKNWDLPKLKRAYHEYIIHNYSPLSEYIPPNRPLTKKEKEKYDTEPKHPRLDKSRLEYLEDLYNLLIIQ